MTKLHEQCVQGPLGELKRQVDEGDIVSKGEFVIVVSGAERGDDSDIDVDRMLMLLSAHLSAKEVARITAELTGQKKNALYERILELQGKRGS